MDPICGASVLGGSILGTFTGMAVAGVPGGIVGGLAGGLLAAAQTPSCYTNTGSAYTGPDMANASWGSW